MLGVLSRDVTCLAARVRNKAYFSLSCATDREIQAKAMPLLPGHGHPPVLRCPAAGGPLSPCVSGSRTSTSGASERTRPSSRPGLFSLTRLSRRHIGFDLGWRRDTSATGAIGMGPQGDGPTLAVRILFRATNIPCDRAAAMIVPRTPTVQHRDVQDGALARKKEERP